MTTFTICTALSLTDLNTAILTLMRRCYFVEWWPAYNVRVPCADPRGKGSYSPHPRWKSQSYRVPLVRIPWKITKLPSQHSMFGHHRYTQIKVCVFKYFLTKQCQKKDTEFIIYTSVRDETKFRQFSQLAEMKSKINNFSEAIKSFG